MDTFTHNILRGLRLPIKQQCCRITAPFEHPCLMSTAKHVFVPIGVADGGLPCTTAPPIVHGNECIPTAEHPIPSGYVCNSVCGDGKIPFSVYQCKNADWPDTVECIDTTNTLLCTAADSTTVGTGIAGITGPGCGSLTAVDTECEIICKDGYWGMGKIACAARARRQLSPEEAEAAGLRRAAAEAREARRHPTGGRSLFSKRGDDGAGSDLLDPALLKLGEDFFDGGFSHDDSGELHRRQLATAVPCSGKLSKTYNSANIGNGKCDTAITGAAFDLNCAACVLLSSSSSSSSCRQP